MARARFLAPHMAVAPQIMPGDLAGLAKQGFKSVICNRPDNEGGGQPTFMAIAAAARAAGMQAVHLPVRPGAFGEREARAFASHVENLPKPILAYCASGNRAASLWQMSQKLPSASAAATGKSTHGSLAHDIVIIGAGAAGLATAASLRARSRGLDIALIDPAEVHDYQPGWTLVGAGIFTPKQIRRPLAALVPRGVRLIRGSAVALDPVKRQVRLADGRHVGYKFLVVATGLVSNWSAIEGLEATLGKNSVTSNYRHDLASYTWQLVSDLKRGRAIFTQPPLPVTGAGAPQNALYLSGGHWLRQGALQDIQIDFFNAGDALFGVKDYVPALQGYMDKYRAEVHFQHVLTKIDGPARRACFTRTAADGSTSTTTTSFDMIHVVPPQRPPDWIKSSVLADAAGWVDVDQATLRHRTLPGVYALGDVCNAPNAKTTAAAHRQAPVVAHNLLRDFGLLKDGDAAYDGYSSCPLTVERGKVVLAEFGYGGKILPSAPTWMIDGTRPSKLAWHLKQSGLPPRTWRTMLRGGATHPRPTMPV